MAVSRSHRIAEQIQRELAELIRLEVRDPRVRLVTLTAVELSRDHSHAKIFFTTLGAPSDVEATQEGLDRAAGFLRTTLAHKLSTRTVPELHFAYDESVERGVRLSKLIDEAVGTPAAVVPAPAPAPAPAKPRRTRGGGASH